jgi:hypothetical protein
MLRASYNAAIRNNPALKDIVYDFDRQVFVDTRTGRSGDKEAVLGKADRLSNTGKLEWYHSGSNTGARAALLNSILRGQGTGTWRGALAELGNQLRRGRLDPALEEIFYSETLPGVEPTRNDEIAAVNAQTLGADSGQFAAQETKIWQQAYEDARQNRSVEGTTFLSRAAQLVDDIRQGKKKLTGEEAQKLFHSSFLDNLNTMFHDSRSPFIRFIENTRNFGVHNRYVQHVLDAMNLVSGRRDHVIREIMSHSGDKLLKELRNVAKKNHVNAETMIVKAGNWATARFVPEHNRRLLKHAEAAADDAWQAARSSSSS